MASGAGEDQGDCFYRVLVPSSYSSLFVLRIAFSSILGLLALFFFTAFLLLYRVCSCLRLVLFVLLSSIVCLTSALFVQGFVRMPPRYRAGRCARDAICSCFFRQCTSDRMRRRWQLNLATFCHCGNVHDTAHNSRLFYFLLVNTKAPVMTFVRAHFIHVHA